MAQQRVLLLTDRAMEHHRAPGHPERPERLTAAWEGVVAGAEAAGAALETRVPEPVSPEALERVHDPDYLRALDLIGANGPSWLDPDTYIGPESMAAARLAAGATLEAARAVSAGEAEVAFAVVRPPGHHAARRQAAGFCLVNNIAVATCALRAAGQAERIAIVDWDVHHGDGTQDLFDADPTVAYTSSHQSPLYPGTGDRSETGRGAGVGTMHNHPLQPGSGNGPFTAAWTDELLPAIEAYRPDAILVSAGYDGHEADPLAHLEITETGYGAVARAVGALAARLGLPGVALTLEGGYDLEALTASVAATVAQLLAGLREGHQA
jgi:acetoin utilization deacetylase AcuC-like enzyme